MKLLILFFVALAAAAQPTISNTFADTVESHCVRIGWTTAPAAITNYVKIDTVTPPVATRTPDGTASSGTEHGYTFCGLVPATLYYYRPCSTSTSVETCDPTIRSFTTAAAAPGYATLPIAPATVTDTIPTITGSTFNVLSDCSNLQTQITAAAAADISLNHEVVIPGGTVCLGRYSLPARVGATGWVWIRTSGVIPPAGSRTSPTLAANNARIISPFVAVEYYNASNPGSGTEAGQGWLDSDSTNANAFLYFWNGSSWAAQAMASAATNPTGACTVGEFSYNNVEADAKKRVNWCGNDATWRNLYIDTAGDETPYAGLYAAANAIRYRITGVTIEPFRIPTTYAAILPTSSGNGDQKPSQTGCLAYTTSTSQYIIFDRMLLDGVGYPNRARRAFCFWHGQNIALTNSYVNQLNYWRPIGALETTPSALINFVGDGPQKIDNNNFYACSGICIMYSDDSGASVANPADITISRNSFYEPASFNSGDSTWNGRRYDFRHFIECKRCTRIDIKGNTINGGFPITNQGAQIAMTPRNGNCATKENLIRVSDVNIAYNWSLYSAQFLLLSGQNDSQNNCNTKNTVRVAIRHNVIESTGITESGGGTGSSGLNMNGQIMNIGLGLQDFSVLHNSIIRVNSGNSCCNANMISHGWDSPNNLNSRLWVDGNIYTSLASKTTGYWGIMGGDSVLGLKRGTTALDMLWKSGASTSYSVTGNAMQIYYNGPFPDDPPDGAYPAGNYRNATVSNFTGAFFECVGCTVTGTSTVKPDSIFAAGSGTARAADGYQNGPDYVQLTSAMGSIRGPAARATGSTTATVTYTAPDATACTVEYGTSATELTGTRVLDSGGARGRSVALTGLTTATGYHYRVYCAGMVAGTFTTQ